MKRYFIFIAIFLGISNMTWAQPYFSKQFRTSNDRTAQREILLLDDHTYLISMIRVGGFDYMNTGWLHLSNEGEVIDSFFFDTHLLTLDGFHVTHKIGDTILQIARHRDDVRQEIHVYGSSFSRRDSIFHWRYSFEDFGDIVSIRGGTSTMTSDSTLVIFGIYRKNDQHTQSRFIMGMELDLDGNVVRKKEIHRFDTRFNIFSFQAPVLVKDEFYYLSPSLLFGAESYRNFLKVDKALDLEYVTTYPKKTNVDRFYHGFTFNHDSTQFIISDARHIEHEDIAHLYEGMEEEEYWDSILLFTRHPLKMTAYDTEDGSIIWDRIYLERKPDFEYYADNMISSAINGDLIFCGGIMDLNAIGTGNQYMMGLVGRADSEGELKWMYRVVDHFGAPWIFGFGFTQIIEEPNGDLVALGGIENLYSNNAGWIVRLGPDGCVQENHCFNDTLSFHTFTNSVQPAIRGELTVYLQAYPNPVRADQPVYLRQEGHVFTGKPLEYSINDLKGNKVAQGRLEGLTSDQIVVELPSGILPGVYLIDLIENREKKYHAKIVVSGT